MRTIYMYKKQSPDVTHQKIVEEEGEGPSGMAEKRLEALIES